MISVFKKLSCQIFTSPRSVIIWGIALILFLFHQFFQKAIHHPIPIADNWLDPFLFPILFLPFFRLERQWLLRKPAYRLSGIEIMGICIGLMLLSEVLLPWLSTRFYFDPVDLMMIGLGGVVYYWGMR
jgi:hypothetical protein